MGELVPISNQALAIVQKDPEQLIAEQEKRIKEAEELEAKLKVIQESIPTRIYNTASSSAGAGSSDFHMYRMIRKAEQERWKRIEAASQAQQEKEAFEAKRKAREEEADAKTAKNRAKRQKKKAKAKAKSTSPAPDQGPSEDDEPSKANDVPEQAELD